MKVILIDDEELALKYLEYQLLSIGNIEILGKFMNPLSAEKIIQEHQVDLIFLDIQMPEIDGLQFADKLLKQNPNLNIVFVTAYDKYAIKAFELNALDYILKPVSVERLTNTINRIKNKNNYLKGLDETKSIKLKLFGSFQLINDENRNITLKWRTSKAEQLFLYLLHQKEKNVDKMFIIELLWPDIAYEKAIQQLYTCIYQIRKLIQPYKENFILENVANGYILKLHKVETDTQEFEELINSNTDINKHSIATYERIIEIVGGKYLEDYDYVWHYLEAQRFELLWLKVVFKTLDWYYENKELDKATHLCLNIIARYPLEDRVYLYLMKIFAEEKNNQKVKEYYNKLRNISREELGEDVSNNIKSWYRKWEKAIDNSGGVNIKILHKRFKGP